MSNQAATRPVLARDILANWFGGRLTIVGTTALGFIVTFLILGSKIASLKNAILPLLAFVPIYLLLISLNMVWGARTVSRFGQPTFAKARAGGGSRVHGLTLALGGLAFGVVAALWYVHSVSK